MDIENIEKKNISVILADDHVQYRKGLKMVLGFKKDITIVAEADNGYHLLHLLKTIPTDVILLDIQMPLMDGILTLPEIKKLYPNIKVIMITMIEEREMVKKLMGLGASSYLAKTSEPEIIYDSILACYSNGYYKPII